MLDFHSDYAAFFSSDVAAVGRAGVVALFVAAAVSDLYHIRVGMVQLPVISPLKCVSL